MCYGLFMLQPDIQAHADSDLDSVCSQVHSSLAPEHSSFIPTSAPLPLQFFQPGAPSRHHSAPFSFDIPSLPRPFFKRHPVPSPCSVLGCLLVLFIQLWSLSDMCCYPQNYTYTRLLCVHGEVVEHGVLKDGFGVRQIGVRVPALLPVLCDSDKLLSLLEPPFLHL